MREFFRACLIGDVEKVASLLDTVNINSRDIDNKTTGLMQAAWNGKTQVVKLLLQHGASIDLQDVDGETALMAAIDHSRTIPKNIVRALIDGGANLNIQNKSGWTALMMAAQMKKLVDIVEILLKSGAKTDIKNNCGDTALDKAIENQNIRAVFLFNPDMINEQDDEGRTWLMQACSSKDEDEILFLYEKGADFFIFDFDEDESKRQSAYDILVAHETLSTKLQALKEILMLDNFVDRVRSFKLFLQQTQM